MTLPEAVGLEKGGRQDRLPGLPCPSPPHHLHCLSPQPGWGCVQEKGVGKRDPQAQQSQRHTAHRPAAWGSAGRSPAGSKAMRGRDLIAEATVGPEVGAWPLAAGSEAQRLAPQGRVCLSAGVDTSVRLTTVTATAQHRTEGRPTWGTQGVTGAMVCVGRGAQGLPFLREEVAPVQMVRWAGLLTDLSPPLLQTPRPPAPGGTRAPANQPRLAHRTPSPSLPQA